MPKGKAGKKGTSSVLGGALGVAVCVLISLVGAAGVAALVVKENMELATVPYGVVLLVIIATAAGCLFTSVLTGVRKIAVHAMTAGGYALLLILSNVFLFGGAFHKFLLSMGAIAFGMLLAAATGFRKKRTGKKYKLPAYR